MARAAGAVHASRSGLPQEMSSPAPAPRADVSVPPRYVVPGRLLPAGGRYGLVRGRFDQYQGVTFVKAKADWTRISTHSTGRCRARPSMFTFLWDLYEVTGDAAYVQALYRANDNSAKRPAIRVDRR